MPKLAGRKKVKTDKRDAALIARCLVHRDYSPVHIPTEQDEQVKEFIQMRQNHKLALKKVEQQILAFACDITIGMTQPKIIGPWYICSGSDP